MYDPIKRYIRWQERKLNRWGLWAMIFSFPIIFILFFVLAPGLSAYRFLGALSLGLSLPVRMITGGIIFLAGLGLYLWTIVLFARAKGTQVPIAPTQKLVTSGPYAVSRNPMVTGAMLMVIGVGLLLDSGSFLIGGHLIPAWYLLYIKLVEEKELEARFGEAYRSYKKSTPFILPKLTGKK